MQVTEQDLKTKEIELMISYGSAASEAMLDYPCHFFEMPNYIGMIAYRIESKCAIVFGDPLCPLNELRELTYAFHKFCENSNLNVIYIAVSEKFARIAQEHCHILMEVCEELIFNPQNNPIFKSSRLQHRMGKAADHGLTFHEYIPHDEKIEHSLLEIGVNWQKARKGLGLHLGHLNFFEKPKGKRWFYTKDGDIITSMAMLSRLDAQKGWLLKFFFTLPNTFPGTSEFLMTSLLTTLRNENCHFLTKGMVPVDLIGEVEGLRFGSALVKQVYKMISIIFKFKNHKQYWERYYPAKAPAYLVFSNQRIGFNEIRALLKVLKMD